MTQRVSIHLNLSGTIALADFATIASLVVPDDFSATLGEQGVKGAPVPSIQAAAEAVKIPEAAKAVAAEPAKDPAAVTGEVDLDAEGHPWSADLDAEGHPWSADLHASTKGKTKAGLWRMAPGKSRPEPAPGFTKVDDKAAPTGTEAPSPASTAGGTAPVADAEDDEFAAFTAAAKAGGAPVAAARKWSEADLSKLCNAAATKLGGERVGEIKGVIAKYVTPGETPHSRNIPDANRETFAVELEALAGITFEG